MQNSYVRKLIFWYKEIRELIVFTQWLRENTNEWWGLRGFKHKARCEMFLRSEVPNLSIYKVAKHVGGYNIKLELQLLPSFEK